jgi:hypothetical protein
MNPMPCNNCDRNCSYRMCYYNSTEKGCKFDQQHYAVDIYSICEPTAYVLCPYGRYTTDVRKYQYCSINPNDICIVGWDGHFVLRYPTRLKDTTPNMFCEFSKVGKCEIQRTGKICCN